MGTWYDNLKARCGKSDYDQRSETRKMYKEAIKPPKRAHDSQAWVDWVDRWETAMMEAKKYNLAEATDTSFWTSDFFDAVKTVVPMWTVSFRGIERKAIENGTLTYRETGRHFRQEILAHLDPKKGRPSKGAFGSTFAGENARGGHNGDAQTTEADDTRRAAGKGLRNRGTKRQSSDHMDDHKGTSGARTCPACSKTHSLERCYYVFPNLAPKWFMFSEERRQQVSDLIKTDSDLKDQVEAIKRTKRARSDSSRTNTSSSTREKSTIEKDEEQE